MNMKKFFVIVILFFQIYSYAQNKFLYEKPPVFSECENMDVELLQKCFDNQVFNHVFNHFKVPQEVSNENYKGDVVVLFEVDKEGNFRRSEEHTSELQSRPHLVCRLLLEKKKRTLRRFRNT